MRSGPRTGLIHGWSGVSSRRENDSTGRGRQVEQRKTPVYGPRPQQVRKLSKQVRTIVISDAKFGRKFER